MKKKTVSVRDIKNKRYIVPVNKLSFRPSVYGVIIKGNKILLAKAWDGYDLPGGGIDLGESIADALQREVFEETGVEVEMGNVLLVTDDYFKHPYTGKFVHSILLFYNCKNIRGTISDKYLDSFEKLYGGKAEWVDINKAMKLKFYNPIDCPALIKKAFKFKH